MSNDSNEIPNIVLLEYERLQWSLQAFPEATQLSSIYKLESELIEIKEDISNNVRDPEEYADALMCLFDSAARGGISVVDIINSFEKKLAKNKLRRWSKNADNSYSHISDT